MILSGLDRDNWPCIGRTGRGDIRSMQPEGYVAMAGRSHNLVLVDAETYQILKEHILKEYKIE